MNVKKASLGVIALLSVSILLFSGLGTAIQYEHSYEDDTGDVNTKPLGAGGSKVNNSDIDLTKVETKKEGTEVVFTLKVDGAIKKTSPENESYFYGVEVIDEANITGMEGDTGVSVTYAEGNATYNLYNTSEQKEANCSVSGGELTIRVPEAAFSNISEFNVFAQASNDIQGSTEGGTDILRSWKASDTNGGGTPGFGILAVMVSVPVATYFYKKSN